MRRERRNHCSHQHCTLQFELGRLGAEHGTDQMYVSHHVSHRDQSALCGSRPSHCSRTSSELDGNHGASYGDQARPGHRQQSPRE